MKTLDLDVLKEGLPGITESIGAYMNEAAKVALVLNGFKSGVILTVDGYFAEQFQIIWTEHPSTDTLRAWNNLGEAASYGAVAISLLLFSELTNFVFFEQATYQTGIDYWLSTQLTLDEFTGYPKREGRVEISGIFKKSKSNTTNMRISIKKKQMKQSDKSGLEGWVSIVEFSTPKAKIEKK